MEGINLIHGDSLQALKGYADNHFDVAIVDPPYGIGESGGKIGVNKYRPNEVVRKEPKHKLKKWDSNIPNKEYFNELFRVSKNQIIWGANYMVENLPPSMGWVFWDKKNEGTPFSDGEFAYTSFKKGAKMYRLSSKHGTRGGKDRIHPTEKPIKLYKWILENYTNENDLILDTHLGSGSIAIACHYMKRNLIGYEIDKEYYDAACRRFKEQTMQQALW